RCLSDWSSDVCSSDLVHRLGLGVKEMTRFIRCRHELTSFGKRLDGRRSHAVWVSNRLELRAGGHVEKLAGPLVSRQERLDLLPQIGRASWRERVEVSV